MVNEELRDLLNKKEDLHSDLVPYVETSKNGWQMLRHPLVYQVPYSEMMNAMTNRQYAFKKEAVEKSRQEREWDRFIGMHERAHRMPALVSIQCELTNQEYWKMVGWVWIDSENIWQNLDDWLMVWRSVRTHRYLVMDKDERSALALLPDKVQIYRGTHIQIFRGISWTTNKDKAVWFARRYSTKAKGKFLATAIVEKCDIKAHFLGRNENEIVVLPEDLQEVFNKKDKIVNMDWIQFLNERGIDYVTSGPNTARGNISVHCPWCGESDTSQHLGISLLGKGWGCWRNNEHRGKSNARLVSALIGCSFDEARRITGGDDLYVPSNFSSEIMSMLDPVVSNGPVKGDSLCFHSRFRDWFDPKFQSMAVPYLMSRRYSEKEVELISRMFDLRFDPESYRVIIPIYYQNKLVTWTGRSIANKIPRYKTLSVDVEKAKSEGMPPAILPITDTLFEFDYIKYGFTNKTLIVCEGPFDAIKITQLGLNYGVCATCLFTKNISITQINRLSEIPNCFDKKYIMLDSDSFIDATKLADKLHWLGFQPLFLPGHIKDPAELNKADFREYIVNKIA